MIPNGEPVKIFIGWDASEKIAWHVLAHSITKYATMPVALIPLRQKSLRAIDAYWRGMDALASTEFSLTRFIVPYLCRYRGYAIFMDCDMLVQADIAELLLLVDPDKAVSVVKHDYIPSTARKMNGQIQTAYPRKNWSSLMVFNNDRCRELTMQYVNEALPAELHRFDWCDDERIGALPREWNWLVDEYTPNPSAKILHYTLGGPWFPGKPTTNEYQLWITAKEEMLGHGN